MTANESTATGLSCPKCGGAMRAYERNGITIDQCTECRGIFLDRGELERLVEAEDVHYDGRAADDRTSRGDRRSDEQDRDTGYRGGHGEGGGRGGDRGRRRGGFLGDLLDFG